MKIYLVIVLGIALVLPTWCTINHSLREQVSRKRLAEIQSISGKKSQALEWIRGVLTLGADTRSSRLKMEKVRMEKSIDRNHKAAVIWGWILAAGSGILIFTVRSSQHRNQRRLNSFPAAILWSSFLFLFVGLIAPIFMFQKNFTIPLAGQVVYQFEMLSIPGAARKVWEANPLVACLIVCFSMVTPFLKLLFSLLVLLQRTPVALPGKLLVFISKWSMADVFIVAVLLAVFSLTGGQGQIAAVSIGFYFFFGYCLLAHFHMVELAKHMPVRISGDITQT